MISVTTNGGKTHLEVDGEEVEILADWAMLNRVIMEKFAEELGTSEAEMLGRMITYLGGLIYIRDERKFGGELK